MKTYKITRETPASNWIVRELNAKVLLSTFSSRRGLADLYRSPHTADELVGHGACPPVGAEFVRTVNVEF